MARPAPMAREALTQEQHEQLLAALAEGVPQYVAAQVIGLTSTRLNNLRTRDPDFNQECVAAISSGQTYYQDWLRGHARSRVPDSDRILEVELATHVPEYAHLRRDRVKHEGRVEHAILLTVEMIEAMDDDDLAVLEAVLSKHGGGVILDGQQVPAVEPPALRAV